MLFCMVQRTSVGSVDDFLLLLTPFLVGGLLEPLDISLDEFESLFEILFLVFFQFLKIYIREFHLNRCYIAS